MRRILRYSLITAVAVGIMVWLVWLTGTALRDPRFLDGWILAAGCCAQVLFGVRRKAIQLPLGKTSMWMQAHIYVGYFLAAAFALHTQLKLPEGMLESVLWVIFVVLLFSGVVGAYLSRTLPSKLARTGGETGFEDIPAAQFALARKVDGLVLGGSGVAVSPSISELYVERLHEFLQGPKNLFAHLRRSDQPVRELMEEIDDVEPYLDDDGKKTLHSIRDLVSAKDDLDNRYAHEWLLKAWLFVHIPATYGMIVLSVFHIAAVYAFTAGAQ